MDTKTFFENFETIANAPGGIARLRELILDLAVRGKLVQRLPDSDWNSTVQLKDVGKMIRGVTYAKAESSKSEGSGFVPLLGAANIQHEINYEGLTYVPEGLIKSDQIVSEGDILICMSSGSKHLVGKTAPIQNPPHASFGAFCAVFRISEPAHREYIARFFKSPIYRKAISSASRGIGIINLRIGDVECIELSLPSFNEQKLIVAKVDELMALCDRLEVAQKQRDSIRTSARKSAIDSISTASTAEELNAAWKRINQNWTTFADTPESISSLRSLILDLAVRGSLAPRDTGGLSASQVTKSMRQKRQADIELMNRGDRKHESRQKTQPQYFPDHWERGLLGDVCLIVMGNSPSGDSYSEVDQGVPLINGPVEFSPPPLGITQRTKFTTKPTFMCKRGDILVCVRGATTGRTNIAGFDACIGRGVALVRGYESQKFINLYMWNIGSVLLASGKGTTFPSISYDDLANLEIAIPPIDEQMKIVTKVEVLMALCDELELSLLKGFDLAKNIAKVLANEVAA